MRHVYSVILLFLDVTAFATVRTYISGLQAQQFPMYKMAKFSLFIARLIKCLREYQRKSCLSFLTVLSVSAHNPSIQYLLTSYEEHVFTNNSK